MKGFARLHATEHKFDFLEQLFVSVVFYQY